MNAEQLAQFFHETYNRLAPEFGHRKRQAKAKPWTELSELNKNLLTAVVREMLFVLDSEYVLKWSAECASHQAAEQARVCACGHVVSEHHKLAAPDGTPYLLCAAPPYTCGDIQLPDSVSPRCSIPAKVAG